MFNRKVYNNYKSRNTEKNLATILNTNKNLLKSPDECFTTGNNCTVNVQKVKSNTIMNSYLTTTIRSNANICNPNEDVFRISLDKNSPSMKSILNGDYKSGLLVNYALYENNVLLNKKVCKEIKDYLDNKSKSYNSKKRTFWEETITCSNNGGALVKYLCIDPQLAVNVILD